VHFVFYAQNNTINDKDVIEQLIKSKDETITALKKQVELLEHVLNNK
jgi:hypothetical protein